MIFSRVVNFILFIGFVFPSPLYALTGAGVLPIFDDGTVLLGKEFRFNGYVWADFGGKPNSGELPQKAARREFIEETAYYTFPHITSEDVAKAPFAESSVGGYRMYFVPVHGQKPSIQTIVDNAKKANKKLGAHSHVEKVDWAYVPIQHIIKAPWNNAKIQDGSNRNIFGPMNGILRQKKVQDLLHRYINLARPMPLKAKLVHPQKTHKVHMRKKYSSSAKKHHKTMRKQRSAVHIKSKYSALKKHHNNKKIIKRSIKSSRKSRCSRMTERNGLGLARLLRIIEIQQVGTT